MNAFEKPYWEKLEWVIGVDEAGRGPMAGPLVVCGVILPLHYEHPIITDSKKLSEKLRKACFVDIVSDAIAIWVEIVSPQAIDQHNIYKATQLAMETIVKQANVASLVDAMPLNVAHSTSIIKGDQKSISIAAASIVAKVMRDKIMVGLDRVYPEYGFIKHKGYPTALHKQAIIKHGRSPIHRQSFMFKEES